MDNIIYAENVGNWYEFSSDNFKIKLHEVFDDYANRHWWEKGIYYDYDFIVYYNLKTGKNAIITSFWDIKGKILGCADCAMTKLWYVREAAKGQEETDLIRDALRDIENVVPRKVYTKYLKQLNTIAGIKLYKDEELIKL